MNIKRITSAILGLPLVIIVLCFGNKYIVDVAFAIIAIMALHEYFNAFKKVAKPVEWLGYLVCALIGIIHLIPKEVGLNFISIALPITIMILFAQVVITNMKTTVNDIAITFFGICYIPIFLLFIPIINAMENGRVLVWFILIAAWGTDVFAYIAGKTIGKHKLNSDVSPNKTIEGCIAGTIGAIILVLIYTWVCNTYFSMNLPYIYMFIIAVALSIAGQIGDFAASSIKRYVGIKDFSNLIPGHGGMLDRIDSVIFIAPFAYILIMLIVA